MHPRALNMPRPGVYALADAHGRVWVAKTEEDVDLRVAQHLSGERKAPFLQHDGKGLQELELLSSSDAYDLEDWLRREVLARMLKHGMFNVRGWLFADACLTPLQQEMAFQQICYRFHLCALCGRDDHHQAQCSANTRASWAADGQTLRT
jgi:hypothetical protein